MFNHLIESGSHRADLRRKGGFFLGTLGFYAVLFVTLGVGSIYAYNTHLDNQTLEINFLVAPPLPPQPPVAPTRDEQARQTPANANHEREVIQRAEVIPPLLQSTTPPQNVSTVANAHKEVPRNAPYVITGIDRGNPLDGGGIVGPRVGGNTTGIYTGTNNGGIRVETSDDVPPPVTPTPRPPTKVRLPSSVITSKVINKPVPPYPMLARQTHVSGLVTVEILIDEQGRVISAQATSGHPVLRVAAQQAALQARFSPTLLSNQPVKVSGVISYNFMLQ